VLGVMEEFCVTGEGFIFREELYTRYKEYCGNNGMKPMAQNRFNAEIEGNFPDVKKGQDKVSRRRVWRSVTFLEDDQE